ncbi:1986_t:CDS:2, partial [Racocetra persica]
RSSNRQPDSSIISQFEKGTIWYKCKIGLDHFERWNVLAINLEGEAAGQYKAHLHNDCLKVQNNILRQYFGDNFQCNNSKNVSLELYNVENLFDHFSTIQEPQQDELELLFAQANFI